MDQQRTPLKSYMLKEITQPVLIIHVSFLCSRSGIDWSVCFLIGRAQWGLPIKICRETGGRSCECWGWSNFVHSQRCVLCPSLPSRALVDTCWYAGGAGILNIVAASITNQVFTKFVSRLAHRNSDVVPSSMSKEERMAAALSKLALLTGDPSVALRDPFSSLSFSCLTPDVVQGQSESLTLYRKGEWAAFEPCGPNGRPIRRLWKFLLYLLPFLISFLALR